MSLQDDIYGSGALLDVNYLNQGVRPGPGTDFIEETYPGHALGGGDPSIANTTYLPDDYHSTLQEQDYKQTDDWDPWADEDEYGRNPQEALMAEMDLMNTYGTTDLDNIKKQNRWASAFTGGNINKWKQFRKDMPSNMTSIGESLMSLANRSNNPFQYKDYSGKADKFGLGIKGLLK